MTAQDEILADIATVRDALNEIADTQTKLSQDTAEALAAIQAAVSNGTAPDQATMDALAQVASDSSAAAHAERGTGAPSVPLVTVGASSLARKACCAPDPMLVAMM